MGKKYRISKINPQRCYSVSEIAKKQMRHKRTVQSWIANGLPVLDKNRRPYLVLGADLMEFLKMKQQSRKLELKEHEIYCVKCRAARNGRPESLELLSTGKALGPNAKQLILRGVCEECGTVIQRFTSDRIILNYTGSNMKFRELQTRLEWNNNSSLNNQKEKEI
jgi:hypothetical protein